jgi:hypothetical protein
MLRGAGFEPAISDLWDLWDDHFSTPQYAPLEGFEPTTLRLTICCSNRWSYRGNVRDWPELNRLRAAWQADILTIWPQSQITLP